ncbi:FeoA family protein [Harryflintia acetispora]|uniref:FeoA family protein n=1 Tax=Harryflintia acetispora TaxID=1849041 RepID=UPI00189B6230|nr:FeoA family protein [Harryflintia acetispora]
MTLRELRPGQRGVVVAMRCEGALRRRLLDMGLTRGTLVRLLRIAPLGDPLEIALMGYELSLRRADAGKIEIELISE